MRQSTCIAVAEQRPQIDDTEGWSEGTRSSIMQRKCRLTGKKNQLGSVPE